MKLLIITTDSWLVYLQNAVEKIPITVEFIDYGKPLPAILPYSDAILVGKGSKALVPLLNKSKAYKILWYPDDPLRDISLFTNLYTARFHKVFLTCKDSPSDNLPAEFMPPGCDPTYHYISQQFADRPIKDLSFIGTNHCRHRRTFVETCAHLLAKEQGSTLNLWGDLWESQDTYKYHGGAQFYHNYHDVLNSIQFLLNHHYFNYGPNFRLFEGLACGCMVITDQVAGLQETFSDSPLPIFTYPYQYAGAAVELYKLQSSLGIDSLHQYSVEMSLYIRTYHSWYIRLTQLLKKCDLL